MLRAERGTRIQRPGQLLILAITIVSLSVGLMGCSSFTQTPAELEAQIEQIVQTQLEQRTPEPTTGDLEAQVLQVLKDNPEAIIESVQAYQQQQQQNQAQAREQQRSQVVAELLSDVEALVGESPTRGADSSELVLIEFSDFQCPFCARATATVDRFMEAHGDEVKLVYKHLPLTQIHSQALPAAQAAWAAQQQDKFWQYHDLLFQNQRQLGDEFYVQAAEELDLDLDQFNEDRQSDAAQEAVLQDIEIARQLQIGGTPFFLLNQEMLSGARPYDDFVQALETAKEKL